jgi:hypothetical protein
VHRLRVDEETMEVEVLGVVTPKGARVVAMGGEHLVVKLPGRHFYGGQGRPQSYAPAEFCLYGDVREAGDGMLEGRVLLRWPVRDASPG